jgi:hypothetical protein
VVWSILAAILFLFLLALWLIRFRYHLEYESPAALRVVAGVHFLWWKKILSADPLRALGKDPDEDGGNPGSDHPSGHGEKKPSSKPASGNHGSHGNGNKGMDGSGPGAADGFAGQRGALRLPESWVSLLGRIGNRFRRAGLKWALDPGVWRLIAAFGWRSSRRVLWLARPRMQSLHLGLANAYDLSRLASVWSVAQATLPALACPVSYGFGARAAEIRMRLGGRFTALEVALLGLVSLTTFPFGGLLRRFAQCWRDPELAGWQKRVLLP